jgi:Winged helix-turn-helix domain (DUF2582)
MSAKKSASSSARKPAPSASGKSSANGRLAKTPPKPAVKPAKPAASPAKPAIAPGARPLAHLYIGEVAGEVWGLLANGEAQTLAAIKKSIDAPADLVVAAVGWLAREDKLAFTTSGRTVKLSLKR